VSIISRVSLAFLVFVLTLVPFEVFAQENAESLIDLEFNKIAQEFQETKPAAEEPIPQSKLLEELQKPGNEGLLEQLRNGQLKSGAIPESEMNINDIKDMKEKEAQDKMETEDISDEDDKKLKVATSLEKYFDKNEYFESIRDFYGYKIFLQDPQEARKNRAETEIYAPRNTNHIVGPGDSFFLTVWGDAEFQKRIVVSGEGTVYIENVGVIPVHGLNIEEFERKLKNALSGKYRTINPQDGNPTTFFDIYFDKLSVVNVYVTGEVNLPGPYQLSPNSTMITALIFARGVTSKGSLRNIEIIRDGKIHKIFDVYDYLQTGKEVNDVLLKNGDNIFVGTRRNTISLEGEVLFPLKYELKEGETLADLIKYSGGLLATAAIDKIQVERIVPLEKRISPIVYTTIYDADFTKIENGKVSVLPVDLYDRDVVKVHSIPKIMMNYVSIGGAVFRKGRYHYDKDMTLDDLIKKSGGILADAYTSKIELIRTLPDQNKEYISLDLNKENTSDMKMNNLDSINIKSKWDLLSRKVVIISGYIKQPGFEYLADSTRVSDLIFSRGGILDEWRKNRTYLLRAELTRYNPDGVTTRIISLNLEKILNGDKEEDILLNDGDQLRIYDHYMIYNEGSVEISGYVKNEGIYRLSTNMTVEDLILKAHGFKEGAFEFMAIVFRMNNSENKSDSLSHVYEVKLSRDYFKKSENTKSNFLLRDNDHIVVRKSPYFRDLRKVTISGEVLYPGLYSLVSKNETMRDLIERAGGLTSEAFIDGVMFSRDSVKVVSDFRRAYEKNENYGIVLKDKDDIHIPKHPGTVSVEGFVYTPGLINYRKDWSVKDYINAAGGTIADLTYLSSDPVIYYPGGNAGVDDGWFFSPTVKEGSRIVVPKVKREAEKEWRTEIRAWLGLLTSAITLVLLYQAAQN
jgi:polysaccharide biosynthesis/export protein